MIQLSFHNRHCPLPAICTGYEENGLYEKRRDAITKTSVTKRERVEANFSDGLHARVEQEPSVS